MNHRLCSSVVMKHVRTGWPKKEEPCGELLVLLPMKTRKKGLDVAVCPRCDAAEQMPSRRT